MWAHLQRRLVEFWQEINVWISSQWTPFREWLLYDQIVRTEDYELFEDWDELFKLNFLWCKNLIFKISLLVRWFDAAKYFRQNIYQSFFHHTDRSSNAIIVFKTDLDSFLGLLESWERYFGIFKRRLFRI